MINFVTTSTSESLGLIKIKRWVKTITTVVLVVYIVVMAGFLGWGGYLVKKEEKVSVEVEALRRQIAAKSEEEVIIRKMESRVAAVKEFLANRIEVAAVADVLGRGELIPVDWSYDVVSGKQTVTVETLEVGGVERFANFLTKHFNQVRLEVVDWKAGVGWTGSVSFSGLKGENGPE